MISDGLPYYLSRDMPNEVPAPRYRVSLVKHVRGLTVFLLTRAP
jgi:hypothetical protein